MQWILMILWSAAVWELAKRHTRLLRLMFSAALFLSMGTQLALLALDGLLAWQAAVPLHLCSLFGLLSIGMVWHAPAPLYEACCFLGAPAAFLTLFFPAPAACSHPFGMQLAFHQLHVLVALMPFFWHCTQKPLPIDPRRTLVLGSGYILVVCFINQMFETNYLFLRAAPSGTPLEWMMRRGPILHLCSLVMLCMPVFRALAALYRQSRKYVIM